MSFQEKRSLVSLISTLLISVLYYLYIFGRAAAEGPVTTEDPRYWAAAILILIPVFIVFKMLFHLVFVVISMMSARDDVSDITDEFDRLVELKSTRNFYHVFMAGFLLSLAALVMNQPQHVMLLILIAAIVVASTVSDLSEFYYYRRGV